MAGKNAQKLVITISAPGVRETLAAFQRLPKEASKALRDASAELAETLVSVVREAAQSDTPQSALMAPTVKVARDRVPAIQAGGTKKVGRYKVPAYVVLLGSEFGALKRTGWFAKIKYAGSSNRQYRPHRGKNSYWFFKAVYDSQPIILKAWEKAADDIVKDFNRG